VKRPLPNPPHKGEGLNRGCPVDQIEGFASV
jgi:hypothetical protein